jgi:hypothetical protein
MSRIITLLFIICGFAGVLSSQSEFIGLQSGNGSKSISHVGTLSPISGDFVGETCDYTMETTLTMVTGANVMFSAIRPTDGSGINVRVNGDASYDNSTTLAVSACSSDLEPKISIIGALRNPGASEGNSTFTMRRTDYTFSWVGGEGNAILSDPRGEWGDGTLDGTEIASGTTLDLTLSSLGADNADLEWSMVLPQGASEVTVFVNDDRQISGLQFDVALCAVRAIPTLGQWAIICLMLILMVVGVVSISSTYFKRNILSVRE